MSCCCGSNDLDVGSPSRARSKPIFSMELRSSDHLDSVQKTMALLAREHNIHPSPLPVLRALIPIASDEDDEEEDLATTTPSVGFGERRSARSFPKRPPSRSVSGLSPGVPPRAPTRPGSAAASLGGGGLGIGLPPRPGVVSAGGDSSTTAILRGVSPSAELTTTAAPSPINNTQEPPVAGERGEGWSPTGARSNPRPTASLAEEANAERVALSVDVPSLFHASSGSGSVPLALARAQTSKPGDGATSSTPKNKDQEEFRAVTPSKPKKKVKKLQPSACGGAPLAVVAATGELGEHQDVAVPFDGPLEPVVLNVYHLIEETPNNRLDCIGIGLFHTGVEVYRMEWSYGEAVSSSQISGIFVVNPRTAMCNLKASILVGYTRLSPEQVDTCLHRLENEWLSVDYHVTHNNCNHFADYFLQLLSCGQNPLMRAPAWVNRLSNVLDWFVPKRLATWAVRAVDGSPPVAVSAPVRGKIGNIPPSVVPEGWYRRPHFSRPPKYTMIDPATGRPPPALSTSAASAAQLPPTGPRRFGASVSSAGGVRAGGGEGSVTASANVGREAPTHREGSVGVSGLTLLDHRALNLNSSISHVDPSQGTSAFDTVALTRGTIGPGTPYRLSTLQVAEGVSPLPAECLMASPTGTAGGGAHGGTSISGLSRPRRPLSAVASLASRGGRPPSLLNHSIGVGAAAVGGNLSLIGGRGGGGERSSVGDEGEGGYRGGSIGFSVSTPQVGNELNHRRATARSLLVDSSSGSGDEEEVKDDEDEDEDEDVFSEVGDEGEDDEAKATTPPRLNKNEVHPAPIASAESPTIGATNATSKAGILHVEAPTATTTVVVGGGGADLAFPTAGGARRRSAAAVIHENPLLVLDRVAQENNQQGNSSMAAINENSNISTSNGRLTLLLGAGGGHGHGHMKNVVNSLNDVRLSHAGLLSDAESDPKVPAVGNSPSHTVGLRHRTPQRGVQNSSSPDLGGVSDRPSPHVVRLDDSGNYSSPQDDEDGDAENDHRHGQALRNSKNETKEAIADDKKAGDTKKEGILFSSSSPNNLDVYPLEVHSIGEEDATSSAAASTTSRKEGGGGGGGKGRVVVGSLMRSPLDHANDLNAFAAKALSPPPTTTVHLPGDGPQPESFLSSGGSVTTGTSHNKPSEESDPVRNKNSKDMAFSTAGVGGGRSQRESLPSGSGNNNTGNNHTNNNNNNSGSSMSGVKGFASRGSDEVQGIRQTPKDDEEHQSEDAFPTLSPSSSALEALKRQGPVPTPTAREELLELEEVDEEEGEEGGLLDFIVGSTTGRATTSAKGKGNGFHRSSGPQRVGQGKRSAHQRHVPPALLSSAVPPHPQQPQPLFSSSVQATPTLSSASVSQSAINVAVGTGEAGEDGAKASRDTPHSQFLAELPVPTADESAAIADPQHREPTNATLAARSEGARLQNGTEETIIRNGIISNGTQPSSKPLGKSLLGFVGEGRESGGSTAATAVASRGFSRDRDRGDSEFDDLLRASSCDEDDYATAKLSPDISPINQKIKSGDPPLLSAALNENGTTSPSEKQANLSEKIVGESSDTHMLLTPREGEEEDEDKYDDEEAVVLRVTGHSPQKPMDAM